MNLIQDIYRAIQITRRFFRNHHVTLAMLNGTYTKQLMQGEMSVLGQETTISIKPYGTLYQITTTDYVANEPEHVQTFLATYGYSNMLLTDMNYDRYFIFDTASQSMYQATLDEHGETLTELFIKNL